jgi:hypothetical protein
MKKEMAEKALVKIFVGQYGSNAFGIFSFYWSEPQQTLCALENRQNFLQGFSFRDSDFFYR